MIEGTFFALIPPFLDSTINFLDKFLLSKHNISTLALTIYSGIFAFASGTIILLATGLAIPDLKTIIIVTFSGFAGLFILLSYFKALTYDEASRVASLFQFGPVLVLLLSFIFLHEILSMKEYLGAIFIIIAAFLFSIQHTNGIIKINKAFYYMLLANIFSALVYITFKFGVTTLGFWQSIPYEALGNGLAALFIISYKDNLKIIKKEIKQTSHKVFLYVTISEIIYRISRYCLFFALLLIPIGIVSVLQGFQPLFLLLLGIILSFKVPHLINEIITPKTVGIKIFGAILIFVGLYCIYI